MEDAPCKAQNPMQLQLYPLCRWLDVGSGRVLWLGLPTTPQCPCPHPETAAKQSSQPLGCPTLPSHPGFTGASSLRGRACEQDSAVFFSGGDLRKGEGPRFEHLLYGKCPIYRISWGESCCLHFTNRETEVPSGQCPSHKTSGDRIRT